MAACTLDRARRRRRSGLCRTAGRLGQVSRPGWAARAPPQRRSAPRSGHQPARADWRAASVRAVLARSKDRGRAAARQSHDVRSRASHEACVSVGRPRRGRPGHPIIRALAGAPRRPSRQRIQSRQSASRAGSERAAALRYRRALALEPAAGRSDQQPGAMRKKGWAPGDLDYAHAGGSRAQTR